MNTTMIVIHNLPAADRHRDHGAVTLTPYSSEARDVRFYHVAVAGRLRRNYRLLRRHGLAAATARMVVADVVFATHMAAATGYRSNREQVAS